MSQIELSKDAKTLLVDKLQTYFTEELDYDLGQFPA